ncbi:MAG: 30S ribosomal protein S5 [Endomicrobia bacterium]|nr:30S ribosomal protein S5 [Endomicrobiia bacterium]MCX7941407.1 30S ribosomal protein S5 [Endomicrobiia bacterium]MDW8055489.1 30S ribosomal protein S5 [Elusimicrobiota bacterium]
MEQARDEEINITTEYQESEPYSTAEELAEEIISVEEQQFEKYVVSIRRVAKVLKGGKRLSFSAMVVVGNKNGLVGFAMGKANEVPSAIDKAARRAMKKLMQVKIVDETIPHEVIGKWGATKVLLKPAKKGTGVIAGLTLRAVMDAAGIKNIVTKIIGSTNPINVVYAAFNALQQLYTYEEIVNLRQQQ